MKSIVRLWTQNLQHIVKRSFNATGMCAAKIDMNGKKMEAVVNEFVPSGIPGAALKVRKDPVLKKIDSPKLKSILTEGLQTLLGVFQKHKYELRIVGGAVRDILMEIKPTDVDLATDATPEQMRIMFTAEQIRMINPKGELHGTITARINEQNFEVTTLRIDIRTDGRHAEVQFTTNWQLDANRRDLTINSMFLGFDGTLYDYFYGYEDLKERRVVFVGDPSVRIREDYLRILRYFRFYGRIAEEPNNHDEATLQAMRQNAEGLARISGERIWTELQKIIVGNFANHLVTEIVKCGLSSYCGLPKEPNLEEFNRVYQTLRHFPKPHPPILLVIALLNDSDDAIRLHERLKLSAFERDLAFFITQQRDKVGPEKEYDTLLDFQTLCLQPYAKREFIQELLRYINRADLYEELKKWEMPPFPLTGTMLMENGCPPKRKLGLVMSQLKMRWANSDFKLTSDELLKLHLPEVLASLSPPTPPKPKKQKV